MTLAVIPPTPQSPGSYGLFQPNLNPGFLQQTYGAAWNTYFGLIKDQLLSWIKQGIAARFALTAPLDSIGLIGLERGMSQGVNETLASYQSRILNAWGAWTIGGTAWGMLAQLSIAGYSTAYIVSTNGYIYGPSGVYPNGCTVPNPLLGNTVPGTPPAYTQVGPWYTNGQADAADNWQANTTYTTGTFVVPTNASGMGYWWVCAVAGESGSTQPTWIPGSEVVDNGVTWAYGGQYLNKPVNAWWTFGTNNGQGDPGYPLTSGGYTPPINQGVPQPGTADVYGAYWNRFVLFFDPPPATWTNINNSCRS